MIKASRVVIPRGRSPKCAVNGRRSASMSFVAPTSAAASTQTKPKKTIPRQRARDCCRRWRVGVATDDQSDLLKPADASLDGDLASSPLGTHGALWIEGGSRALEGGVMISGSKNSALPILAASILCSGERRGKVILDNVPVELLDVRNMVKVLESVGVRVATSTSTTGVGSVSSSEEVVGAGSRLELDASSLTTCTPDPSYVKSLRASFLVAGPLVSRLGQARVALPGGCRIGTRPVDLHLDALRCLGARVREVEGESTQALVEGGGNERAIRNNAHHRYVQIDLPRGRSRLVGCAIRLRFPSVGATETAIMAAAFAEGRTTIENAAMEPEVEELARFLNNVMGTQIRGAGSSTINITGVGREGAGGTSSSSDGAHEIIPDRIEAGTFLACSAVTRSDLLLKAVEMKHIESIADAMRRMGCLIEPVGDSSVRVSSPSQLRSIDLETGPYPEFPTDMQPMLTSMMALAQGRSTMAERIFENRMNHLGELRKMGARVLVHPKPNGAGATVALIDGVDRLRGARVHASDLRAGASLVLAGLAAEGETIVAPLHHIDRGYVALDRKLQGLGARVKRLEIRSALT